ncbi:Spy/CpxP family protein refolding chaperone [Longitalea luteola]|uniref:Spy/CpxP family protein refolding chaperone n=1 Tax=Longitalea luteola TaxID=2812563 RepID=UPI001A975B86|nr:hypothetical protein [Longitalea luteola]
MKKAIVGIALATFVALGASAQDDQSMSFNDRPKRHHQRYDKLQQLNLTDEQKTAMKSINEDFKQQMTDLKKSEDRITVTEWKSKMATIRKDRHEKVDKVLTAGQKAELKKMKPHGKKFRQDKHNRIDRMQQELNLTAEQRAAVEKHFSESQIKMRAVHDDKSLTEDQKKQQYKTLHTQQQENLKSILTADQWNKYQELKKNRRHGKPVQS